MKKIFSILSAIALVVGFTACSSEQDIPYEELNNQQVYFPNTLSTTVELSPEATTFELPVMRMGTDAVTIPLIVTMGEENPADLQFPASVSFAEGKKETSIVVSYDPTKVEPGYYNNVNLSFGPDYNTPYGYSAVALKVGQAEPWVSLGWGSFYDDFWMGESYPVEILQNELDPQSFRLVKPFPAADYEQATDMLEFRIYKAGETLMGETLTEDVVYWDYHCAALSYFSNYDDIIYMVWPGTFTKYPTQDTWTHNRVLSYQENGLPAQVQFAPYYYMFNNGGWDYTQDDGMFVINFPGVVIADYSCEVAYTGKFIDVDDNVFACANATLGADVASAKAGIIEGANPEPLVNGLADGSIEGIDVYGEFQIAMPADAPSGKYTIAVVTFDANGEAQNYNYDTFKYVSASADVVEWDLTKNLTTTYEFSQFWKGSDNFVVTPNGDGTFTIKGWNEDIDFTFTLNADNTITWEPFYIGYTDANYGDVYLGDLNTLFGDEEPSYYDPTEGTFYFNTYYYVEAGYFGYGMEPMTITGYADVASAPKKHAAKKNNKKFANNNVAVSTKLVKSSSKLGKKHLVKMTKATVR